MSLQAFHPNALPRVPADASSEDTFPDLMDMLLEALADVGGVGYLADQAEENPRAFLRLLGRVLRLQKRQRGAEPVIVELLSFGRTAEPALPDRS